MLKISLKVPVLFLIVLFFEHGNATNSMRSRIIGGENQEITHAPYLVSIRYKKNQSVPFEHRCSGTIFSSRVILTTATCVIGLETNHLHVKAGSTYRSQNDGYLYMVEKYIIHPEFNIWFTDNDLALVILAFNLTTEKPKEIASIALASSVPEMSTSASIAGWGVTDPSKDKEFSEILQFAKVQLLDVSVCKQSYGENRITPAMLCAAGNGTDACLGDAGGALVYNGKALGLVSWGSGCAKPNFPGVYTNLLYFKTWIEEEVNKVKPIL